ncbi:MAG: CDP-diacylglycerol--glycerol-3-phosphate 3-phosphatidyltransferase [Actinomycetota bacterium]|jgi:CDP-diacylglycerol---glycerol-3-phosphate 3-phosphatidyltransferase
MPTDPNAIRTWANAITVSRLLVSPLMFAIIPDDNVGSWAATGLWFVLCLSDLIDGNLARKQGVTRSGAFLDPLADKVCVLGAMFVLVDRGMLNVWLVGIIATREIAISLYRVFAGAKGVSVPASQAAKFKTFAQQVSVGFAVLPWSAADYNYLAKGSLVIATALTLYSGLQYANVAIKARKQA